MKKMLMLMGVAVMVLGLALSAQASQIINSTGDPGATSIWNIVNGWFPGASLDINDFQNAAVLEELNGGSYVFSNWARYSAWSQRFGYTANTVDTELKFVAPGQGQGVESTNFSSTYKISFFDKPDEDTNKLRTTINQNSPNQSSGFIFDLSQFSDSSYTFPKCYVVAFEDQLYGDSDYNDFVAQVCPAPIPGSLLLLGSGMIGLLGLRRKMIA